jgi:hypothetical protein
MLGAENPDFEECPVQKRGEEEVGSVTRKRILEVRERSRRS